jgi:hypothetical protein
MRVTTAWLGLLSLMACGPAPRVQPPLPAAKPPAASLPNAIDGARPSQYRLIPLRAGKARPLGELRDELRLLHGRRIVERGGQLELADTVAVDALTEGRELPAALGGGFLFWNGPAVYRSRTFTGRLEPQAMLPFSVGRASFGPDFVLLRGLEGDLHPLDIPGAKARRAVPVGLMDIAAAADGRVVMALELGRYVVSTDGNVTQREVQAELGQPVHSLSSEPLGFVLQSGTLIELSPRGELLDRGAPRRGKPVLPWPRGESALEQAVAFGVLRGTRALVAQSASVVEVDLESGKVLKTGPQLLPGDPACQLFEQGSELLMKCSTRDALSVLGQVHTDRPVLEQTFDAQTQLISGFEHLLVNRDCAGAERPYTVCVRKSGGVWHTVSAPAPKPVAPAPTPQRPDPAVRDAIQLGYGFKANGNAISFVRRGDVSGYRDLVTEQFVALKDEVATGGNAELACRVEENGSVSCLGNTGPQRFGPDGTSRASLLDFTWVESSGERALGLDYRGALFQSDDWGRTWSQVAAPPQLPPPGVDQSAQCSAVGCRFGGWLRVGWEHVQPAAQRAPEVVALPSLVESPRPGLVCTALAEPNLLVRRPPAEQGRVRGFGTESAPSDHFIMPIEMTAPPQFALGELASRGMMSGQRPADSSDGSVPAGWVSNSRLRFLFVDYFDTRATKRSANLNVAAWLRAVRLAGGGAPHLVFEDQLGLQPVPVLSVEPGKTSGMTVSLEYQSAVWFSNGRAWPMAIDGQDNARVVTSSLSEKSGALVALLGDGSVVRYANGAVQRLFRLPAESDALSVHAAADALAVTPEGEYSVLRFTGSSEAPDVEHPLLAYRAGKPLEVLAPFSSVLPASDAACRAPAGHRAIVLASRPWLKVAHYSADENDKNWGFSALVRWSTERVCVEALEVAAAPFAVGHESVQTRIVATFGAKPSASRQGFAPGVELVQALRCTLERPR